jgi:hypothetical protein
MIHILAMLGPEWLGHPLGQCPAGTHAEFIRCRSYNFWSGIGSDIGELTIVGGMVTLVLMAWHYINCNSPGCYRISKHHYIDKDGKRHALCHAHDVDDHPKGLHWWSFRKSCSLEEIHRRIKM